MRKIMTQKERQRTISEVKEENLARSRMAVLREFFEHQSELNIDLPEAAGEVQQTDHKTLAYKYQGFLDKVRI